MRTNTLRNLSRRSALAILLLAAATTDASAQCALSWQGVNANFDARVATITTLANGDVIVAGEFTTASGLAVNHIARWDGSSWSPLGAGVDGVVNAVVELANGDLAVGGIFATAGGVTVNNIARWDGQNWSPLGSGMSYWVNALTIMPNGDLVAGGAFSMAGGVPANRVARWDGAAWSPLGPGINNGIVMSLLAKPDGTVLAGGLFGVAGSVAIAYWDGTSWLPLSTGMSGGAFTSIADMQLLPNGDVVVVGGFSSAGGQSANNIARWDGASWSALGTGTDAPVAAVQRMPNGDLIVGGYFTTAGGVAAMRLARWDGVAWSPVAAGPNDAIRVITPMANGDLLAGGNFTSVGALAVGRVARLTTSCPAAAAAYGVACSGSAGLNELTATTLPWIGADFHARTTGLPANALAVGAFAAAQLSLPLPQVHPLGAPGCVLLVTDEILLQFPINNGGVHTSIAIPDSMALVGANFYHQVVVVELHAVGAKSALTSSNALALTIGAF